MANKVFFLFLLGLIGAITCIRVDPVKLLHDKMYITYQLGAASNLTVLQCPVELEKDEVLKEVNWTLSNGENQVGWFNWIKASGGGASSGLLEGVVKRDRKDGNLEFTTLRYNLTGFYTCMASTVNGKTAESATWELLVVDTTANSRFETLAPSTERCKYKSTFRTSPTYPEPTLHSGLYSKKKGGFVEEVKAVDWKKIKYSNKTVAYSHENVIFEITPDTPMDIVFMNTVGITKTDGTYITLTGSEVELENFHEQGCPLIKVRAYQTIAYNSEEKTCRDEVKPLLFNDLKATVRCSDGYKPAGDTETVELTCNQQTWKWTSDDDTSFMCVISEPLGTEPDSAVTTSCSLLLLGACLALLRLRQQ